MALMALTSNSETLKEGRRWIGCFYTAPGFACIARREGQNKRCTERAYEEEAGGSRSRRGRLIHLENQNVGTGRDPSLHFDSRHNSFLAPFMV